MKKIYLTRALIFFMPVLIFLHSEAKAKTSSFDDVVLKNKRIMYYTPHILNPKYFGFEFGFVTDKKIESWNFPYNAFAKILLAEDFYKYDPNLRAGALGFKLGLMIPTQPWIPISLELAIGYAKTSLQKDPWLGEDEDRLQNKDLFMAEGGLVWIYNQKLLFRLNYQYNNVDYFVRKVFFSIGSNF